MNTRLMVNHPAASAAGRRRAAITLSLLLAALLNAGALGLAGQRARPAGLPIAATPSDTAARAVVQLLAATANPVAPTAPRIAKAPPPAESALRAPHAAHDSTPPGSSSPFVATSPAEATPPQPHLQPVRFYTFNEVDRAAEPEADWPLDIATLDTIGIARLVFEVLVDDRGSVIACTVLDPSGLPEAARADLEQRLAATPLRPALRGDRFVASQRRIELLVEPNI